MSEKADVATTYRFRGLELRPSLRELRRGEELLHLQPRPFDLLLYLVRNRDRVVSRHELLAEVWPDVTVSEEALRFAAHALRRAVGDDGARQEVVATVPRAGLRFVASVEVVGPGEARSGATTAPPRADSGDPFFGREQLLARGRDAMRAVLGGEGRVLLLSGEAGIGKSRTASQLGRIATEQGLQVASGHCVEGEGAPAFWPWAQILGAATRDGASQLAMRGLGDGAVEVARLVPELRDHLAEPIETPKDSRAARFLLHDSVTTFLERVSERNPLMVVLDDLHRADHPSLLLFRFAAREIRSARILLVGTYRDGELRTDDARSSLISEVSEESHAHRLALGGLSEAESGDLLTALSGRSVSGSATRDLHVHTRGNPFFLTQMLRVLGGEGRLEELSGATPLRVTLPRGVQEAIARQLSFLAPETREALEIASVLGREFSTRVLAAVDEIEENLIAERLLPATEAGIVSEIPESAGELGFSHVLVRDALYGALPALRRLRLHAQAAEVLERIHGVEPGPHSAVLAHHFYAATAGHPDLARRALSHAECAGDWAVKRVAFEEAVAHYSRALELAKSTAPDDEPLRCRLLLALGDAQTKAAHRDEARTTIREAGALAQRAGLPEALAHAALRFAPDFLSIETGVFDPDLVELLEEALAAQNPTDSSARARLMARLSVALHWADGSETRRQSLAIDALAMAERIGDSGTLEYARTAEALALYSIEHPERYLDLGVRSDLDDGDEPIALLRQLLRLTSLLILGRVHEYDIEVEAFAALAERLRQPQALWYTDLLRSTRMLMEGRYDEAKTLRQRYLTSGNKVNDRNALHSFMVQEVMTAFDVGEVDRLEAGMREMVERFPRVLGWRAGLALFYAELGRHREASEQFARVMNSRPFSFESNNSWSALFGSLARTAHALDQRESAREIYNALIAYEGRFAIVGFSSYCWGHVDHLLALLAETNGDIEEADSRFRRSIADCIAVGALPSAARASLEYAVMLMRSGRSDEARRRLALAAEWAAAHSMFRLTEQVNGARAELA